jgi:hypothetical protein
MVAGRIMIPLILVVVVALELLEQLQLRAKVEAEALVLHPTLQDAALLMLEVVGQWALSVAMAVAEVGVNIMEQCAEIQIPVVVVLVITIMMLTVQMEVLVLWW